MALKGVLRGDGHDTVVEARQYDDGTGPPAEAVGDGSGGSRRPWVVEAGGGAGAKTRTMGGAGSHFLLLRDEPRIICLLFIYEISVTYKIV